MIIEAATDRVYSALFIGHNNSIMFSGIVRGAYPVRSIERLPGLVRFSVEFQQDMLAGLEPGASVAVDGVCLTVVQIDGLLVTFEAMQETLIKTTIPLLEVGSRPNIERSLTADAEIGGHITSGHVDATATIAAIFEAPHNRALTFQTTSEILRYIFPKGFIAIDGMSLTVVSVDRQANTFSVWLIPETLRRTAIGGKQVGDLVNLELHRETQTIVDTVTGLLQKHLGLAEGTKRATALLASDSELTRALRSLPSSTIGNL